MSGHPLNPVRGVLLLVGRALARLGLVDPDRAERTTELSWPRIVTGLARMSKSAADVAMVGLALGPAAIAGVGFAAPFWGLAFALGGGIAGGTIGLVSQRYSAERFDELDLAVKASVAVVLVVTLPLAALFWVVPEPLIRLIASDPPAVAYGTTYLEVVSLGVPFAALNLVGSRTLVGADDAWTPMVIRAGGAVVNVGLNAVLIFGLGLGVVGAAVGTVLANVVVTAAFAGGLTAGRFPGVGELPVRVSLSGPYLDLGLARQLVEIGAPLVFTNLARTGGRFPLLAIVGLFGSNVVAAFVVAQRVRELMNTPGWGFSLASSSLVGQQLGVGDEREATAYARDVLRFAVGVYLVSAGLVFAFADPIGGLFVNDPEVRPLVSGFIYAACVAVVFHGVSGGATGPLRASGDTRWPFYGQVLGLYLATIPVAYLGVVTPLGVTALYVALVAQGLVPAVVTYHRFASGTWTEVSRSYRPDPAADD